MTDEVGQRLGAIILPDGADGIRPTFYVLRDGAVEFREDGSAVSQDWDLFAAIVNVVRAHYAEKRAGSRLVGAAVAHGAEEIPDMYEPDYEPAEDRRAQPPQRRAPPRQQARPAPRQQRRDDDARREDDVPCERCGGPTRTDGKRFRSPKSGRMRMKYECRGDCESNREKNDGSYWPYATWVDA